MTNISISQGVVEVQISQTGGASVAMSVPAPPLVLVTPMASTRSGSRIRMLDSVEDVFTNTDLTYALGSINTVAAGDVIRAKRQGHDYVVALPDATDYQRTLAGGVKVYIVDVGDGRAWGVGLGADDGALAQQWADYWAVNDVGLAICPPFSTSIPVTFGPASGTVATTRLMWLHSSGNGMKATASMTTLNPFRNCARLVEIGHCDYQGTGSANNYASRGVTYGRKYTGDCRRLRAGALYTGRRVKRGAHDAYDDNAGYFSSFLAYTGGMFYEDCGSYFREDASSYLTATLTAPPVNAGSASAPGQSTKFTVDAVPADLQVGDFARVRTRGQIFQVDAIVGNEITLFPQAFSTITTGDVVDFAFGFVVRFSGNDANNCTVYDVNGTRCHTAVIADGSYGFTGKITVQNGSWPVQIGDISRSGPVNTGDMTGVYGENCVTGPMIVSSNAKGFDLLGHPLNKPHAMFRAKGTGDVWQRIKTGGGVASWTTTDGFVTPTASSADGTEDSSIKANLLTNGPDVRSVLVSTENDPDWTVYYTREYHEAFGRNAVDLTWAFSTVTASDASRNLTIQAAPTLRYKDMVTAYSTGQNVIGLTSGATAEILAITDTGYKSGVLHLANIVGTFVDGEQVRQNPVPANPDIAPSLATADGAVTTWTIDYPRGAFTSSLLEIPVGAMPLSLKLVAEYGQNRWIACPANGYIELRGQKTYDPPSLTAGATTTTTVTVPGASAAMKFDAKQVNTASGALSALTIVSAAWSAANTVTVTIQNNTGLTLNETTGTLYVWGR